MLTDEQIAVLIHMSHKAWDDVTWASPASIHVRQKQLDAVEAELLRLRGFVRAVRVAYEVLGDDDALTVAIRGALTAVPETTQPPSGFPR